MSHTLILWDILYMFKLKAWKQKDWHLRLLILGLRLLKLLRLVRLIKTVETVATLTTAETTKTENLKKYDLVRETYPFQNEWIFGKVLKGEGGSFSIQKFMLQIFAIIDDTVVMNFRKILQHNFPKMRGGVKGRLELFRKFIRFGCVRLPLREDVPH